MSESAHSPAQIDDRTRRQLITGVAIAFVGLSARSVVWGNEPKGAAESQSTGVEGLLTYLHQEIEIKATPQRVYEALLDSKQFAAFTGMPAEIDPKVGGSVSMFGGLIVGRNVELVPNQRIVQAWRPASWDPGIYSIVKFELKGQPPGTTVVLDHTGFPEGDFRHLDSGWYGRYWEPLKKFLS
jgi:uncharacterized protein YndB with AHSA1/START domain